MKLAAVMIFAVVALYECGPKQYSQFTVEHPSRLSGQLLDPSGAAVAKLKLVLRCNATTTEVMTDAEGKYDFGVLQAGTCRIGTPSKLWLPPEVKCDERGCGLEKLRFGKMVLT
ncbi:MAG: carboxypeptidase-like regulatory domain-containing protein [Candidatus Acidiferrales bacterium]|jgi:hypothetical protein